MSFSWFWYLYYNMLDLSLVNDQWGVCETFLYYLFNLCETKIISKEKFSKGSLKEIVVIPNIIPASFRALSKFLKMNSLFNSLKVRQSRPLCQC